MMFSLTPTTAAERVQWCRSLRRCFVCARSIERTYEHVCTVCQDDWRYCATCKDVRPVSLFSDPYQSHCTAHKQHQRSAPAFHRHTRTEQAQRLAEVEAMRADGLTWTQIAAHYGVAKTKTMHQRVTTWRKALGKDGTQ